MATEIGHASLGIIPSFDGFGRDLERGTNKHMLAAGATGGTAFGTSAGRTAGQRFGSIFKTAAKASLIGIAGLGVAAFKFAGDAVEEAREGQKVAALTAAVIKSTGGAAKVTEKQVGDLSTRLSEMAGVDDELVQSGANVLLTFTKIRNEVGEGNDIFDQATTATLNMSAALKTDLSSSAIQVGKALNDPVKGVTALGRAGVQFTEKQKTLIESLVEGGDTLGAQKIILEELETQFKGAARSQADEADKLTVAWDNFKEEVGNKLIPVLDDLAKWLRKKGIPAIEDFAGWVEDDAVPAVKKFADEVEPVVGFVKDLASAFNDLPGAAKLGLLGGALAGVAALKVRGGGGGALGAAGSALGLAKPVPVFVTNPGFGGPGGVTGGKPGVPPVIPGGVPRVPPIGTLPKLAPFIPIGLGSSPGSDSALRELTGFGPKGSGGDEFIDVPKHLLGPQRELLTGADALQELLGGPLGKGYETDLERLTNKTLGFGEVASTASEKVKTAYGSLPKKLTTDFETNGIPQSMGQARDLVRQYDLTPKEKRTLFELIGYDPLVAKIRNINTQLDYASRDRRTQITIAYANAGYQTQGGLQEGGGGPVTDRRFNERLNDRD